METCLEKFCKSLFLIIFPFGALNATINCIIVKTLLNVYKPCRKTLKITFLISNYI